MRIIFAGTPEFASSALAALIAAGHEIPLVLTQPDRPAGRGMKVIDSPVKQLARQHGLPVLQPVTLKDAEAQGILRKTDADIMVVVAYGLVLPELVLAVPRYGCLNIHASLLPRWRGAAPIQRAILAGDRESGISIMQMNKGLDTGPVLLRRVTPIAEDDTARTLHDRLAGLGAEAIVAALELLQKGVIEPRLQDESLATYAAKLTKEESWIDWKRDAADVARAVRAYNPFPVARTIFPGGTLLVWQARAIDGLSGMPGSILRADSEGITVACGKGALLLQELQKPGGKRLPVRQFLLGNQIQAGEMLA